MKINNETNAILNLAFRYTCRTVEYLGSLVLVIFIAIYFNVVVAAENNKTDTGNLKNTNQTKILTNQKAQLSAKQLVKNPHTLPMEDIFLFLDDARRIATYRYGDISNKLFPSKFYEIIENSLMEKLIASKVITVIECIECNTIEVDLTAKKPSVKKLIDTKNELKLLGRNLGVDAFFMWNLYFENSEPKITVKVIRSHDFKNLLTKTYTHRAINLPVAPPKKHSPPSPPTATVEKPNWRVSFGANSFEYIRKAETISTLEDVPTNFFTWNIGYITELIMTGDIAFGITQFLPSSYDNNVTNLYGYGLGIRYSLPIGESKKNEVYIGGSYINFNGTLNPGYTLGYRYYFFGKLYTDISVITIGSKRIETKEVDNYENYYTQVNTTAGSIAVGAKF